MINTVQAINKEVSENTVLNGGDNKTEIKVDTTLEGDIVDRAIASAQRKADNIVITYPRSYYVNFNRWCWFRSIGCHRLVR